MSAFDPKADIYPFNPIHIIRAVVSKRHALKANVAAVVHGSEFPAVREPLRPRNRKRERWIMTARRKISLGLMGLLAAGVIASTPATAQQPQRPNIIFIMGDDIGWSNIGAYNQGIMAGRTPNLDRL